MSKKPVSKDSSYSGAEKAPAKASAGREALLGAACHYIATKGLRGLRVEEVAAEAGVATSLIYHHFGDRATLLRSALETIGERAATYTQVDSELNGRDGVLAICLAEIQDKAMVRENSAAWNEFRDAAVFDESLRPALFRFTREWIDRVAELVSVGREDGSIVGDVDPESIGQSFTSLVEGLSTRWLSGFISAKSAREELQTMIEASLGQAPVEA